MVGDLIAGRYELRELAGSGGMSSVYRAYDRMLERPVAIKVLHELHSRDPEYVERFRREAQAIARLSHPNIVTVIDRGEHDGRQYIVFEHVPGENLKEAVQRLGPLPVGRALTLAHQAASGLAFAHQHGVVHRDVKPHNVLIDAEGTAKVTDFGIARSLEQEDSITETGAVLGTSDYLAPEQAAGQRVDASSDQYSFGALLYELLTGDVPYPAPNVVTAALRHMNDPVPSVRAARPELSARVDALVRRAMAKRPEDRYSTTDALVEELEACILEERQKGATDGGQTEIFQRPRAGPARSRPGRRGPGARWLVPAIGLLLVAAAISIGVLATRDGSGLPLVGNDENANAAPVRIQALATMTLQPAAGTAPSTRNLCRVRPTAIVRRTGRLRATETSGPRTESGSCSRRLGRSPSPAWSFIATRRASRPSLRPGRKPAGHSRTCPSRRRSAPGRRSSSTQAARSTGTT